jgi:elongation factor P
MLSLRNLLVATLLTSSTAFAPQTTPLQRTSPLSVAVDTSEIKNGLTIELDGEPYKIMGFSIMKQARGAAKTTIKFKNLKRGTTIENTYRSGEKFETAEIIRKPSQFTYEDDVSFTMNCFCFQRIWGLALMRVGSPTFLSCCSKERKLLLYGQ